MEHVRWLSEPTLRQPVIVSAFTGWNDAGDAASTALRTLVESWGATPVAEIDPEPFTDFATVRPHVRLDEAHQRQIVWPTVGLWSASVPGADVLLLLGPEPALRWRLFSEQVVGVCEQLDVRLALTLGALLADVPHSRPVQLIGTATDTAIIERFGLQRSRYEGPTGIVGVLHHFFADAGLASASLWAAVPGYASQLTSPRAAMALVERACTMLGCPAPLSGLANEVGEYDARVAALLASDDDLLAYVARLESAFDSGGYDDDIDDEVDDNGLGVGSDDEAPAAFDEHVDPGHLVEEVERFLRNRDDG